jgi:phosphotransferase system enzyme I (PtsI)
MPDEREQYEAYKKVVKGMAGRPVTIRTFDLGNDKDLRPESTAGDRVKTNPALGRRAIRLSLAEPRMFQTQLRAILRASKYGPIKLLIPMLAHAHEIDQTLAAVEQAKSSLRGEKAAFDEDIEIGGMIEIPPPRWPSGFSCAASFPVDRHQRPDPARWPSTAPTNRSPPSTTRCTRPY